jgi:flavin reductase (DIM6/NTAB) family NADH-FMN oxidoreductase RutF/pimeloyl-ACP methyl ester carboxylesterase
LTRGRCLGKTWPSLHVSQESPLPSSALSHLRKTIGGTSFIEKGEGEPLLLIHGVGLNAEAWAPQITAFAATHRVIALDMAGHGESRALPEGATLDDYVAQARRLLDDLGIAAANVAGHSMGGLVAIGLALSHPQRVKRLAVLSSVHERSPEARAAVEARAASLAPGLSFEATLDRWFEKDEDALRARVKGWLEQMDPAAYAMAYRIFAAGDRAFPGRLSGILCPALFATGEGDPHSTPAMAEAMAHGAPRGRSAIIPAARHMMTLTHWQETNALLSAWLAERLSSFDNRELRTAFGSFMTGVTIVTTAGVDGTPRGFTANSFTSVSLEPPLLLICIGKQAASVDVFRQARGFAVNILSEAQKETSVLFASKRPDKFDVAAWRPGPFGNPLIEGSAAWFDCARYQVIDAGDHIILMGHVEAFSYSDANPLGYARGHYITLGLEQAAVNAASSASRTVVGAILESDSRLVLLPDPSRPNGLALPEVGRSGQSGSASQLHELLQREGLDATLGFLFAVFENPGTREQCIYYRGEALLHARGRTVLADFEDIPWDRLADEATRSMLRRYAAERKIGRFKVYSGDHRQGTVKAVD